MYFIICVESQGIFSWLQMRKVVSYLFCDNKVRAFKRLATAKAKAYLLFAMYRYAKAIHIFSVTEEDIITNTNAKSWIGTDKEVWRISRNSVKF